MNWRTLFHRSEPAPAAPAPRRPVTAPGERVYCIGDVHGRSDLLARVARFIAADADGVPGQVVTVFLGDLIDRGPDSAGVVEMIAAGWPTRAVVLTGNHETDLLTALGQPAHLATWQGRGGLETLLSYGVPVAGVVRGGHYRAAMEALGRQMPPAHLALLRGAGFSFVSGDYFFCHAGVRPGVALDAQDPADLTRIRRPFLDFAGDFGKVVVHGHTQVRAPEFHANRIALDTGACRSGNLTCAVFEGAAVRLFSTAA